MHVLRVEVEEVCCGLQERWGGGGRVGALIIDRSCNLH